MPFFRKLLYYFGGVGLGLLMVYFLFGNRDIQCSYFPNDRVLSDLRKKNWQLEASLAAAVARGDQDTSGFDAALRRGKIDFSRSEPRAEPCGLYWLELKAERRQFQVENCDSNLRLLQAGPLAD